MIPSGDGTLKILCSSADSLLQRERVAANHGGAGDHSRTPLAPPCSTKQPDPGYPPLHVPRTEAFGNDYNEKKR